MMRPNRFHHNNSYARDRSDYNIRVDERDVPESRHAIFFRGLGKDVTQEQLKFKDKKIFGYAVELTWYRDIRRYIAHCQKHGINPSRREPRVFRHRRGSPDSENFRARRRERRSRSHNDSESDRSPKRRRRSNSSRSSESSNGSRSPSAASGAESSPVKKVQPLDNKGDEEKVDLDHLKKGDDLMDITPDGSDVEMVLEHAENSKKMTPKKQALPESPTATPQKKKPPTPQPQPVKAPEAKLHRIEVRLNDFKPNPPAEPKFELEAQLPASNGNHLANIPFPVTPVLGVPPVGFNSIRRQTVQEIRYEPVTSLNDSAGGFRLSNLARASETREQKMTHLPDEIRRKVEQKQSELERIYRNDCQTFGQVTKKLLSKNENLEKSLKLALFECLNDLESEAMKHLDDYIEELSMLL